MMNEFKIWTEMSKINDDEFIAVFYQDLNDENKTFNCAFSIKDKDDLLTMIEDMKLAIESVIFAGHPPITTEMECKRKIKKLKDELEDHEEVLRNLLK